MRKKVDLEKNIKSDIERKISKKDSKVSEVKRSKKEESKEKIKQIDEEVNNVREVIIERKTGFSTTEVLIIVIISVIFGCVIGGIITYTKRDVSFKKMSSGLSEIVDTYNNIIENYYDEVNEKELMNAAVEGMVGKLDDPYSTYMDEEQTAEFNEEVDGYYSGIGATVSYIDNQVKVISMFNKSPAKKAGMKIDDVIVKVDGKDVSKSSLSDVVSLIKGANKSSVKVTVLRNQKEKELTVIRDSISIPSVTSKIISKNGKNIGYIGVSIFASNTYKQFKSKLKSLEDTGIDSLIIDVRSNPGGHLTQVSKVLSMFLKENKVLYQIQVKDKKEKVYSLNNDSKNYPVAVLINKSSASASEILASCFKETYKKGVVVGITSYGKGSVQKAYSLSSGSSIKYTTEKWLTPSGKSINEVGVEPDVMVELNEDYSKNPSDETDNQLQTALDELTK